MLQFDSNIFQGFLFVVWFFPSDESFNLILILLLYRDRELRNIHLRPELKGIGVRIEDDILITEEIVRGKDGKCTKKLSCEVLSSDCPKTIDELETLMNSTL